MNYKKIKQLYEAGEITYDAYRFLLQSERKMRYYTQDLKAERRLNRDGSAVSLPAREVSYDLLNNIGIAFASDESTEDIVIQIVLRERLRDVLSLLEPGEQRLINELFYSNDGDGKTIREAAESLKMPATTLHRKTEAILKKLRDLFGIEK